MINQNIKTSLAENGCIIVIPIYKEKPSWFERISLNQCVKVLSNYPVCLVCSPYLNTDSYIRILSNHSSPVSVAHFHARYFEGLNGYNTLMTSASFYERFAQYAYMLIYQLDAYIFRDDLLYWCNTNLCFLGAPLPGVSMKAVRRNFKLHFLEEFDPGFCFNGGFSLRKIEAINYVVRNNEVLIEKCLKGGMFEDVIISLLLNRNFPSCMPSITEAKKFSFESYPARSFVENGYTLPTGCHAWFRNDYVFHDNFFWFSKIFPVTHLAIYAAYKVKKLFQLSFFRE